MPNPRHEGPADYLGNIVEGNIDDRSNKGSDSMGWDEVERSWNELKGEVKRQWSKLTDEDVEIIKGKYAQLLGLLQERYGHAKEQAEREINDWAKRLKVDVAAELTALGNDVASLSASVGDLVRRQAAATAGLDHALAAAKLKLEEKAEEVVDQIKGAVVRMSVIAALAVAAAIFALLAFITGLVAFYAWLEPAFGVLQALGIVGGVLAVIALVLVGAAMFVGRGRTTSWRAAKRVGVIGALEREE
jgi:uncharacterized protein YjbJ (UPF0337 family)